MFAKVYRFIHSKLFAGRSPASFSGATFQRTAVSRDSRSSSSEREEINCVLPATERSRIREILKSEYPEVAMCLYHVDKLDVVLHHDTGKRWTTDELATALGIPLGIINIRRAVNRPAITHTANEPGTGLITSPPRHALQTSVGSYATLTNLPSGEGLQIGMIMFREADQAQIGIIEKVILVPEEGNSNTGVLVGIMALRQEIVVNNAIVDTQGMYRNLNAKPGKIALLTVVNKFQNDPEYTQGKFLIYMDVCDPPDSIYSGCFGITNCSGVPPDALPTPIHVAGESGKLVSTLPIADNPTRVDGLAMLVGILALHDGDYSVALPLEKVLNAIRSTEGYENITLLP